METVIYTTFAITVFGLAAVVILNYFENYDE